MATIALCMIVKNEEKNLPILLESVRGCFDEIHITDTGSTDQTIEYLTQAHRDNRFGVPIYLHYFTWVNDFGAARNFSFSHHTCDYSMWMDGDDSLTNKDAFIDWKHSLMHTNDQWLATYHYAYNEKHEPICSFARERVVRRGSAEWKYFVHEGLSMTREHSAAYVLSWAIQHRRSAEDLAQDKGRNLALFEKNQVHADARMTYYWGKEMFENGKPLDAFPKLMEAIADDKLAGHDRVMGVQYATLCALTLNQPERAMQLAFQGLQLAPTRAEFFVMIGDAHIKMGKLEFAIPYYRAAKNCEWHPTEGKVTGPIFAHRDSYSLWPSHQLARLLFQKGDMDGARRELDGILFPTSETEVIRKELDNIIEKTHIPANGVKCDDIVISGHPQGLYEWDEEVAKTRGVGGSEIACIKMARALHELTGRKVLVFNNRERELDCGGVAYRPARDLADYVRAYEPKVHIAWRHASRLTHAPSYVWCHDLFAPGIDQTQNYDKILCLSNFHKEYVRHLFGIATDKIIVTRNGLDLSRWGFERPAKVRNRVVFTSSPDRGLDRAIRIMDEVVKVIPDATLHVYYGFDNMIKMGKLPEATKLEVMMAERPYIRMRGNLEQGRLAKELCEAEVWLYPTNFDETFAISALEAATSWVYPVVRNKGALPNTLENVPSSILAYDADDAAYVKEVVASLQFKRWELVRDLYKPEQTSWMNIALEWRDIMGL